MRYVKSFPDFCVQVIAAFAGGFCGLYQDREDTWQGCLHEPHATRHQALTCAENRLRLEEQQ